MHLSMLSLTQGRVGIHRESTKFFTPGLGIWFYLISRDLPGGGDLTFLVTSQQPFKQGHIMHGVCTLQGPFIVVAEILLKRLKESKSF